MSEREETRPDRERTRALFARFIRARRRHDAHPERPDREYERLRDELVVVHLNLVRFLAVRFANRGEPLDDLVQVGTVGLLKAIDRFDLERGVEFTTYATPTIVGEIKRYFRDKGWAVKVPRRLQELNLAVNRASDKLAIELGRSPTVAELAEHLKAGEDEILEAQELGQAYNLLSLDGEIAGETDKKSQTLADTVGVADAGLELLEDRANLERAFHALSGRERVIIYLRFYESVSQTEIAKRLNVSQMHVSRLQAKALEKLRAVLARVGRYRSNGARVGAPSAVRRGLLEERYRKIAKMKSQELRQAWIDFFVGKQHKLLPPASLVPHEMSTTLFTIAGMEQFVPVFLGEQPPPAPRVVTVQRCLRVAGAKSDIESVGRTGRHGTFLEMLGNFSFGDYYKREAIVWAWEFVTEVLRLDPSRLYVTVHTGDDEAEELWKSEAGLSPDRITRFDEENFWTMGATGPCGPCTEVFYDTGAENASGPADIGPNLGNRYVEIWNIVFQQYNRTSDGKLEELPRKAIDTGAGLERMLAVCNGVASMYQTDLFTDLVAAQPPVGRTSLSPDEQSARRNIIADHMRAATFLIDDGIYPSNTDRGFVLRFLIRRAIRNGKLLGYPEGFLADLVPAVVGSLESGYPELVRSAPRIISALRQEEQIFDRTLERGVSMLDRLIDDASQRRERVVSGEDAFTLHDTYGFPLELTREIAAERGVAVDTVAFDRLMEEQRERARRDAAAKREVVALADLPAMTSRFTGYDEGLEAEGCVGAALKGGNPVESLQTGEEGTLILDRTSFYAERGGQIGDRGTIEADGARFEVHDTQYMGEAIAHHGVVLEGDVAVGDRVRTRVSDRWRQEIRRHHTSAHLLQRALKDILGEEVNQAGSWVGIDRMRFDFRWPGGALSPEQKRAVAHRVNEMIRDDSHLVTRVLPREEAKRTGAIWMSGENYGDMIRVVQAGPSLEFCGGTHSHTTGELGMFVILSEFSIGSGIRRIESCVSEAAEEYVAKQSDLLGTLASTLATSPDDLRERIERMQREVKDLQTSAGQLRAQLAANEAQAYVERAERRGERAFVGAVVPEANGESLRHLSNAIRSRFTTGVVALAGIDNGSVSLLVSASDDLVRAGVHAGNLIKLAAPFVKGKGGGQPGLAQGGGSDASGAEAAVRAIRDAVFV